MTISTILAIFAFVAFLVFMAFLCYACCVVGGRSDNHRIDGFVCPVCELEACTILLESHKDHELIRVHCPHCGHDEDIKFWTGRIRRKEEDQ